MTDGTGTTAYAYVPVGELAKATIGTVHSSSGTKARSIILAALREAVIEPDIEALHRLYAMLSTDPVAALAGLKELADRGSVSSMVHIANAYRQGIGTDVDLLKSNEWFRRATDAGSMLASYELARNYKKAKEYDKTIEMWSLGAENGYPPSMHMLGVSYATGWRVPKNRDKARELLEGAADQGHLYAKAKLMCLLMRGGFGFRQRLRGIRLALSIPNDLVTICRNPDSEHLR